MISNATRLALFNAAAPFENALGYELHKCKNVIKSVYSFAVNGGAVSTIALLDDQGNPALIPAAAIVTRCFIDWYVAATSGGSATVGVSIEGASDSVVQTAVASCTGLVEGVETGTAAAAVKTTVQRQVSLKIAVAALTAGKANVFTDYVISN